MISPYMSYSLALSRSNMQPLYVQRQRYMLMEVFKIYHKQGPLYLLDLFESPSNARRYGCNDRRLVQPKCRIETYGINSFRYQGAKVWNVLARSKA